MANIREVRYICIHHTGPIGNDPLSKSQELTASQVNEAHKYRPDFIGYHAHKSTLDFYGGYNFFIDKDGFRTQFRKIGEETLAQTGHNLDTVSICLAGNFTKGVERPTPSQLAILTDTVKKLVAGNFSGMLVHADIDVAVSCNFSMNRVFPHRVMQPNHTSCYGSALDDTWARDMILFNIAGEIGWLSRIGASFEHLLLILKKSSSLGSSGGKSCEGFINLTDIK